MNKDAKFWNKVSEKYAAAPVPSEEIYQKKLTMTREYLRSDMKILEFGCGTGTTALAHAPYVRHILAIDIADKMLEIAKQKAKKQSIENIDFKLARMEELDVTEKSLDVVLGLSILHLLQNKDEVITQVYKSLKPGGVFISSTTCIADIFKFYKLLIWFAPLGRFLGLLPLVNPFTSKELKTAITKAGFTIDYEWQPEGKGKGRAVFIVAKKADDV